MRLQELIFRFRSGFRFIRMLPQRLTAVISLLTSIAALCLLVYEFGFRFTPETRQQIFVAYQVFLQIFLYTAAIRILLNPKGFRHEKGFWIEVVVIFTLIGSVIISGILEEKNIPILNKINHIVSYILLIFISTVQVSKEIVATLQRHLKPELMFAYSFLFIILLGAFLLMLPRAHRGDLEFTDALFTSASAVCVTGLTTIDISSSLTVTGQIILISLIQIGGIGVMTFTSFIAISFFSQTSFQDQMALKSILNEESMNNIFKTLFYTLFTTLFIEAAGAYLLWTQIRGVPDNLIPNKFFFSLFHSISAFCNAGFSTLSENLCSPVVKNLYGFQSWIAILIILGGIGFPIVFNYGRLLNHKIRNLFYRLTGSSRRMPSHVRIVSTTTRIVIAFTLILLIAGTILFLLFEYNNTLKDLSSGEKLATSFFAAVTPRTAGFNNLPTVSFLPQTIFLTLILMWIGASPMSTGGGIKTTTFAVALKSIYSVVRGKKQVEIANRQLTPETVNRAGAIISLSILWTGLATVLISITDPHGTVTQILFEVTSALSTVGLTLDFTHSLSDAGKIIISITMFVGRVGLITLLSGIFHQQPAKTYTYANDTVIL